MHDEEFDLLERPPAAAPTRVPARAVADPTPAAATAPAPTAPETTLLPAGPWSVQTVADAASFWRRCRAFEEAAASPFQTVDWLQDWYATVGSQPGLEPLLVAVRHATDGQDAVLLPLLRRRRRGLRELCAPDLGVSDYHAPLCRPGLALDADASRALWRSLSVELARHGDLLRLDKMLATVADRPNPLALALAVRASREGAHRIEMHAGWPAWEAALSRQARRERARHERVFQRWPGARVLEAREAGDAAIVLAALERLQRERRQGSDGYRLDAAPFASLYREHLARGRAAGRVVLTALAVGDEVIAALYALRHREQATIVRIGIGDDRWKSCAPGRLLLASTFRSLADQGVRRIDLGVGDHAYKRQLGCRREPLWQACEPLTWRGMPAAWAWRLREACHEARHEDLDEARRSPPPGAIPGPDA